MIVQDTILFIAQEMQSQNIKIGSVSIITNGLIKLGDEFMEASRIFSEICDDMCGISISVDPYHMKPNEKIQIPKYWKESNRKNAKHYEQHILKMGLAADPNDPNFEKQHKEKYMEFRKGLWTNGSINAIMVILVTGKIYDFCDYTYDYADANCYDTIEEYVKRLRPFHVSTDMSMDDVAEFIMSFGLTPMTKQEYMDTVFTIPHGIRVFQMNRFFETKRRINNKRYKRFYHYQDSCGDIHVRLF